jgi:glycosyltransferase involved in cell wall biosynthesis
VDIQPALFRQAGVGRYVQCLAERLGACRESDELALFYFDFRRRGLPFPTDGAHLRAVHWCPGRLAHRAWRTLGWPPYDWWAGPADVYHFTNFVRPPLRQGASIVSVYDASFLRHPDAAEPKNLAHLRARVAPGLQRADAVITISEFSRGEIIELLGVPEQDVFTVYPGLDHAAGVPPQEQAEEVKKTLGLKAPYLLNVGTLEPRKNIPFLVQVFEHLSAFPGELVLAGMRGWKDEPILASLRDSPRADRIRYLGYVDDRWLPGLYAGSELFVFPSLYEGFGFPPLEAMACGTPVVASQGGSLPETLGEAAVLVPGYDAEHWAEIIARLLADRQERDRLSGAGLRQAERYTWEEHARRTWSVYRRVAGP